MSDSGEPQEQHQQEVCNFFKKPPKNKNLRKRPTLEEDNVDEDSKDGSSVVYNKKKPPAGDSKLHFSTGSAKHRLEKEAEKEEPKLFQFESSKEIQVHNDSSATATLETETEFSRDARALREKALKKAEEDASKEPGASSDGGKLYKGIHGYTDHRAVFRRENTISAEKAGGAHGPLRASAHIRVSARFDYQPDICKDYKETGYCGYGDACKFMHDRGDYKSGWQLEREWDEAEKVRRKNLFSGVKNEDEDEDAADKSDKDEDDSLPFACFICRRPFEDPVETSCKHYFCEHCALKHHRTNKKCFVCNQPTNGIFNRASKILKKMSSEQI